MIVADVPGPRFLNHRVHVTHSWLVAVDAVLFFVAYHIATWLYLVPLNEAFSEHWGLASLRSAIFASMTTLAMLSMGLYQPRLRQSTNGFLVRTLCAFALMILGMFGLVYFVPVLDPGPLVLLYASGMALVSSLISREVFSSTSKQEQFNRRVLVLGAGSRASNIVKKMRRASDQHGFRICGYFPVRGEPVEIDPESIVRSSLNLRDYVREQNIHQVVVALDATLDSRPAEELLHCRLAGVSVLSILDFFEQEAGKVLVDEAPPEWFIFSNGFQCRLAGAVAKRAFDIVAAFVLLLLSWPLMLLTMALIKLEDGLTAPVIFRQRRVGLHGREFNVMKFRSMTIDAEGDGRARWATRNDDRVTRVGQVIRKLRIDELPQIFNVLAGDMAFVGPRPERPEFVSSLVEEIPYFDKRHCVKPGITGWAQLNYPYGASVSDARNKLEFDLYYVKNRSLWMDFMVLLQTVEVVLFGRGSR